MVLNDYFCKTCGKIYTDVHNEWCIFCQINDIEQNFANWTSGNEKVDETIQEMQLKIGNITDIIFKWVPYGQFINIKKIGKSTFTTVHSAIWTDGLKYNFEKHEWERKSNKRVTLKCLYDLHGLKEIKSYTIAILRGVPKIYGITQNPDTNDFVMVLQGNDDITTIYTAVWINGPLEYHGKNKKEQERIPNEKVILKYLYNSQNNINEFLNELKLFLNYRFNFPTLCGVSQNPDTKEYIIVHQDGSYCKDCAGAFTNISDKWCKPCQISVLKKNFANWTSGNEKIDEIIQEGQLKIKTYSDRIIEWISYDKFKNINEIGKDDFAELYSAIWKDGTLYYNSGKVGLIKIPDNKVMLKRFYNSRDITNEFFNEVKSSINKNEICGISQNPTTEDYIIVYKFNNYCQKCGYKYITYGWCGFATVNLAIWIDGPLKYNKEKREWDRMPNQKVALKRLHNSQNITRNFLSEVKAYSTSYSNPIDNNPFNSDMGLCGEVGNMDETRVYGVMPYMAPEILRGKPYTQAADIYSFGMIMYFVATGRQPFNDCAHDQYLALNICDGIRPEINEQGVPKFYIDLMKKCWDSNPENRPTASEIDKLIDVYNPEKGKEITEQNDEADEYRKANLLSIENSRLTTSTHPRAYYTSRLLNPFTKDLPKHDSECLDCLIDQS
ncbi:kinase-like domain-containing protein [Rhizophagus irregularis DAOM 181602=DAOM 197198]|nr:kinase-like domain-containing protein [Rhizophagus irregularis DAOM 181602=DAOM 197198]